MTLDLGCVVGECPRRRGRRGGTPEVEALRTLAAEVLHDSVLRVAFDPLGDELQTERLTEADDPLKEGKVIGA